MASVDLIAAVDALTEIVTAGITAPATNDFGLAWSFGFLMPLSCAIVASLCRSVIDMLKD